MKKVVLFSLISILTLSLNIGKVVADSYEEYEEEYTYSSDEDYHRGFFGGAGLTLGYETNKLMTVIGGGTTQIGFKFNRRFSAYLRADTLYTRDLKVDYIFVPVVPVAQLDLDYNFFLFAGVGYTYLWTSNGQKFNSPVRTNAKSSHGFTVTSGGGYNFFLRDNFAIAPQVGFDYTRIAGENVLLPLVRVTCRWFF